MKAVITKISRKSNYKELTEMFEHPSPLSIPLQQFGPREHLLLACQVLGEEIEHNLVIGREAVVVNAEDIFWKPIPI